MTHKIEVENGVFVGDSTSFTYSDEGLLMKRTSLFSGIYEVFVYNGDIVSQIIYYSKTGVPIDTLSNFMRTEDNGNTIIQEITYSAGEKAVGTYKFKDDIIQSYHLYLKTNGNPEVDHYYTFKYDASGNLQETVHQTNFGQNEVYTVLEVDNKKNPNYKTPKILFVLMNGTEMFTKGINNPTKVRDQNGYVTEYEWTYNSKGYPVTMLEKGRSKHQMTFEYNQ